MGEPITGDPALFSLAAVLTYLRSLPSHLMSPPSRGNVHMATDALNAAYGIFVAAARKCAAPLGENLSRFSRCSCVRADDRAVLGKQTGSGSCAERHDQIELVS
jgi:hypothetical protein